MRMSWRLRWTYFARGRPWFFPIACCSTSLARRDICHLVRLTVLLGRLRERRDCKGAITWAVQPTARRACSGRYFADCGCLQPGWRRATTDRRACPSRWCLLDRACAAPPRHCGSPPPARPPARDRLPPSNPSRAAYRSEERRVGKSVDLGG